MIRSTCGQDRMAYVKPKRWRLIERLCKAASGVTNQRHSSHGQSTQSPLEQHPAFDTSIGFIARQCVAFCTKRFEAAKNLSSALCSKNALRVVTGGPRGDISLSRFFQPRRKAYESCRALIVLVGDLIDLVANDGRRYSWTRHFLLQSAPMERRQVHSPWRHSPQYPEQFPCRESGYQCRLLNRRDVGHRNDPLERKPF